MKFAERRALFAVACIWFVASNSGMRAQGAAAETHRVGSIDLFGYSGWDGDDPHTAAARKQLSARVGMEVSMAQAAMFRRKVQGDVVAATGKPASDVAIVCCNEKGELNVFVGIEGESAVPLQQQATPTGDDTLPPEALKLATDYEQAVKAATAHGVSGEDDSRGSALMQDPDARAIQEQMRTYALPHTDILVRVLRRSGQVQQRRAAAELLGYAQRSPAQVRALEDAIRDDDDDVRNNATRALAVLAVASPLQGLNVEEIIGLLYSGVWTDRNQASLLLLNLTARNDPKLLRTLAQEALPPLIEGAGWQSGPHALPFAMLLGRVLGMPDDRTKDLIETGHTGQLVQQAKALESRDTKR